MYIVLYYRRQKSQRVEQRKGTVKNFNDRREGKRDGERKVGRKGGRKGRRKEGEKKGGRED